VVVLAVLCWLAAPPPALVAMAWVLAFLSALHDVVLDGLFVTELPERAQIKYEFIAPLFWSLGPIAIYGGLVPGACRLADDYGQGGGWGMVLFVVAFALALLSFWQSRTLPDPMPDVAPRQPTLISKCIQAARELSARPGWGKTLVIASLIALPASLSSSKILDFALTVEGATRQDATSLYGGALALPSALVGMLWVLAYGLEKTFLKAAVLFNTSVAFALIAAVLGPEADGPLLTVLLVLSSLPLQFASFVATLYVLQQVAPGRFSMSAYALAMAATQLVSWPLGDFSDYLRDEFGFVVLFACLLVFGMGAAVLAAFAPFELKYREEPSRE
jgi:PAT family beta-lactamase induction signal transducer AmpG